MSDLSATEIIQHPNVGAKITQSGVILCLRRKGLLTPCQVYGKAGLQDVKMFLSEMLQCHLNSSRQQVARGNRISLLNSSGMAFTSSRDVPSGNSCLLTYCNLLWTQRSSKVLGLSSFGSVRNKIFESLKIIKSVLSCPD